MSTPALRLHDADIGFGDAPGLHGLSLEVAQGERVALIGASGAGKTTLLRAIAGLAPLRAGTLEIGGRTAAGLPPERRDAVYLHQTPLLFPHLSVFENVAFPLRVRRVGGPELQERVRAALREVRLAELADRPPRALSGGQKHRVALARAVVARPRLLLLDEPLAALDPVLRQELRDSILALHAEYQPALVLVTHDLDEGALLGERVAVLLRGRIAQIAPPAELFSRPASLEVARFLGLPNEIRGELCADGAFRWPGGSVRGTWAPADALTAATLIFPASAVRPGTGQFRGRVRTVRHRSGDVLVTIVLEGGPVVEASVRRAEAPAPGDEVRFEVDGAQAACFADRSAPGTPGAIRGFDT